MAAKALSSRTALRVGVVGAASAVTLLGTAVAANANPVPVVWGDTFSGLVQSHCGTTDWQDVAFPGRNKNLIYAGETIDITCPGQVAEANIARQNTPAPPPPHKAKTTAVVKPTTTTCTVSRSTATVNYWNNAQWNNARVIVQVGKQMGFGRDGLIIALMAAMQESSLINLGYLGDNNNYDSLGLFQQRPSMGWGSASQVTNPYYAAKQFFNGLRGVPNWWTLEKTWAAQDVQRSAYPYAYAKWEWDATKMVNAIAC